MSEKKSKGLSSFGKIVIIEIIALTIALVLMRTLVFPNISGPDMLHIQISTHAVMIGLCASIFSALAILVKRKWKTHKKYLLVPVIFTVFAFLMQKLAEEISVIL